MTLSETINADIQTIGADLGNPVFTWQGEDYECLPGSAGESLGLDDGGFERIAELSLLVRREVFTDGILPVEQQKLTYRGKHFRINKIMAEPANVSIRLILTGDKRGV